MINVFRECTPRPIVGIEHSFGATQLFVKLEPARVVSSLIDMHSQFSSGYRSSSPLDIARFR